jgi:undecaprenyl-diphosphatase
METIANIDRSLFAFLNGMHNEFFDNVMYWISQRIFWIPLYLILVIYMFRTFSLKAFWIMLFAVMLILISDQVSVLIKDTVMRSRPCHDERLAFMVHTVKNKCGGAYGFVSSHAANTMALLSYVFLLTRKRINKWIMGLLVFYVIINAYSRIYLGAHFPADIAGGWIVGIFAAVITYIAYRLIITDEDIIPQK